MVPVYVSLDGRNKASLEAFVASLDALYVRHDQAGTRYQVPAYFFL